MMPMPALYRSSSEDHDDRFPPSPSSTPRRRRSTTTKQIMLHAVRRVSAATGGSNSLCGNQGRSSPLVSDDDQQKASLQDKEQDLSPATTSTRRSSLRVSLRKTTTRSSFSMVKQSNLEKEREVVDETDSSRSSEDLEQEAGGLLRTPQRVVRVVRQSLKGLGEFGESLILPTSSYNSTTARRGGDDDDILEQAQEGVLLKTPQRVARVVRKSLKGLGGLGRESLVLMTPLRASLNSFSSNLTGVNAWGETERNKAIEAIQEKIEEMETKRDGLTKLIAHKEQALASHVAGNNPKAAEISRRLIQTYERLRQQLTDTAEELEELLVDVQFSEKAVDYVSAMQVILDFQTFSPVTSHSTIASEDDDNGF